MSTTAALLLAALAALGGCGWEADLALPPGMPALHQAAARDDGAAVEKLLAREAVDRRGPFEWTALHVTALTDAERAAKVLLDHRARVNVVDAAGMTPLHWAARKGSLKVARLLLSAGAEVGPLNKFDMTPLHEATTVEVAQLLLSKGADIQARDVDWMTPLHTAPNKPVADFLIERGANINARARDGRTPMDMPPTVKPRPEPVSLPEPRK